MTRELNKISRISGRDRRTRGWRVCLLGLCLAAAALISQPAWAIRLYLRGTDGAQLSGSEWQDTAAGAWNNSGSFVDLGGTDRSIEFIYRGKDVYWTINASNGQWGMPHETFVVNPHLDATTNFYFLKYSNTLSVVSTGIVTETNVTWSFLAPSALLTNSSAYKARYTNTHYGDGSPVATVVNPMPTGAVTITFSDVIGYIKPANIANFMVTGADPQAVTGVYTRQTGHIHILPQTDSGALSNAGWTISAYPDDYPTSDPVNYPLSGTGEMTISNVPVGLYTVTFGSVEFYGNPMPVSVSKVNVANVTTDYIANYGFTGRKLTVHVVLAGETNANLLVGAGTVQLSPTGMSTTNDPESFYYPSDTEVTLAAIPSNVVVDGVAYKSYFFEWTGRRWSGTAWVNNELGSYGSPTRINPITLKMDNDRIVTVLFSREKYPWDNAGDLDGDGLPDQWEVAWGLNPRDSATVNGAYGNFDGDWIPSTAANPPALVSVRDDSQSPDGNMAGGIYWVSYDGIAGAIPGYPLRRARMLTPQTLGVGDKTGYAGGPSFYNLLECRGFDGFISTNGGHWTSATTFDAYWTPDDDPGTDPLVADTDDEGMTDGWEYYFWYWRSAAAFARGLTASANLGWVTLNPTIANPGDWDTDGDELTDIQEYLLGTDPTHADTDGDSMDDWWEERYELNPLDYSDALDNADADYMAVRRDLRVLEMTNGITDVVSGTLFAQNVLIGAGEEFWVDVDGDNAFTLYTDTVLIGDNALSNGLPGTVVSDVYYGMVSGLPRYLPGYPVWQDMDGDGIYTTGVDNDIINPFIKHELVYMSPPPVPGPGYTMFNPLTAWFEGTVIVGTKPFPPANTERYNAYQEYLGGDYLGRVSWDAGGRVISQNDDWLFPGWSAATSPKAIDSDGEGIPDGWELFVGLDPWYGSDGIGDGDEDKLRNLAEWANSTHPLSNCGTNWSLKYWPTDPGVIVAPAPNDPHPKDTDWDSLRDNEEFGVSTSADDEAEVLSLGANPTSFDTDNDFLPDGWEVYAGTDPITADPNADPDGDGLRNWQEYMSGTVPEWMGCDAAWELQFASRNVMGWDPRFKADDMTLAFFLPPDFASCPSFLYHNNLVTDLAVLRSNYPAASTLGGEKTFLNYHTTLPHNPDSDGDQMDDYWEVYHGLNPLLGVKNGLFPGTHEIRAKTATWSTFHVDAAPWSRRFDFGYYNYFTGHLVPFASAVDYIEFVNGMDAYSDGSRAFNVLYLVGPQNYGLADMDADGDGLLNLEEYSYSAGRRFYHTDPTPIWRTDSLSDDSFVSMNYWFDRFGGKAKGWEPKLSVMPYWFEQVEGFDTDNDGVGDYPEINTYAGARGFDPLDSRNPFRNRALYLDGASFARTPNSWMTMSESYLTRFSVEAWVRPSSPTLAGNQVVFDRAGNYGGAKLRTTFRLGIVDGLPYVMYDGRGDRTNLQATANIGHRLTKDVWTHIAGVYDGTFLTIYVNGEASSALRTTELPATGVGSVDIADTNTYQGVSHSFMVGARDLNPSGDLPNNIVVPTNYFVGHVDEIRIWNKVRTVNEIRNNMLRRLTTNEISGELYLYATFDDVPDPAVSNEFVVPLGLAELDANLKLHPTIAWWRDYPLRSSVYTGSAAQPYNYIVAAENHAAHLPQTPPKDDLYHFSTNYLSTNAAPADYLNPYNPYGGHSIGGLVINMDLLLFRNARGQAVASWLGSLDPTDPDATDSDGDGLPDAWEEANGLDPYDATGVNGRWGDPDGDGLSNWAEYMANTNPTRWDTDGDGLSDYNSRSTTDPYALTWGELYDDGDGMPDTWETEYGLDPKRDDAHLDKDNDGWSNYAEFIAGTDPSSSGSHPSPRVTGRIIYTGQKTGQYRVWGYQVDSMDGPEQASQIGLDNTVSEVIGYADGTRSYNGRLPYAPVRAGTAVRISAIMYWWDGQQVTYSYATFTFTGPENFTYEGRGNGEGVAGRLDYNTGEFSLTWANDEVPAEGNEISVSYPYIDPANPMFGFSGFKEGPVYLAGILDVNGNNRWDEGEPFGVAHDQPYHLGVSDLRDLRIYLHENLPGYHRFKWSLPGSTNISDTNVLTHVIINHTSIAGSPNHFDLYIRAPRDFFHEWDCQRYGYYGMPAGSYRWWAGAQNGTFYINWSLPERAYAVAPRGATLYAARNQFEWTMGTNATMYHLQVARKESDGRLTMVEDRFYPAPGRDRDGICRDYPDAYASEWGNGTYFWRVAGWNLAGQGPWSGDDLGSVQTFEINLNSSYTRTISGNVYYYGKTTATRLVVEAFDNIGFSGMPEARVRVAIPRTSDPNKIIPFTIKGLPEGAYYVRAYIDTAPFGGTPSGEWAAWKTQGFVQDNNNMYKPGMLALVNTMQLTGRKLVLRDHDLDNDMLPDAWEMEYFGSLNQTGDTDFDGDGETNYQEYQYSSGVLNPRLLDSDIDGLTDAFEVHYNGLLYGYQPRARGPVLNPTVWDSDGDGYSDGAELRRYNTDPLDRASFPYYRPPCYGPAASPADIDGDGRTDAVVYDPTAGDWHVYTMAGLVDQGQFGDASMTPLTGDFDGDGCSDLALYQAASGLWQVWTMSGDYYNLPFGLANMIPVPGDYDGDMFTELALYDCVTGVWHIYPYNNQQLLSVSHGGPTHIPVPGDYDGDGRTDLAVYDPASGVWSIRTWFGQNSNLQWGGPHEIPVPGDYDGDGRTDLAVFNSNTGWWRVYPMNGQPAVEGQFGWYGVIPVPGDYNGDGRTDPAYYYPPTGAWSVLLNGREMSGEFGPAGATPVLGRR